MLNQRRIASRWVRTLWCGAAISALSAGATLAQPTPAASPPTAAGKGSEPATLGEVVVTGTLLRGVAPAGTEVLGVNQEQIQAIGAVSTNQLMASVPQVANQFNNLSLLGTTTTSQVQVNRLNLRNLPGATMRLGVRTRARAIPIL